MTIAYHFLLLLLDVVLGTLMPFWIKEIAFFLKSTTHVMYITVVLLMHFNRWPWFSIRRKKPDG